MDKDKDKAPQDLFDLVGSYGPWQRNIFIIFFCINCIGMWHNFAITFTAPKMEYSCVAPNNQSLSDYGVLNEEESPFVLGVTDDHCSVYISKSTEDGNFNSSSALAVPCEKWEYNLTFHSRTIINEWDLVCEREWLVSFAKSIYMIGFMLSVLFFGQLSDCIGRWPTVLICYLITCASGLISAFSTSYLMFIILRFFQAFGRTGLTTTGFVLIMEIIGDEYRTKVGIGIQVGWTVGFITLPAVAWFVRDWFWFQLVTTFPVIPFFIMYWAVPESPRWLMTQGKMEEYKRVVTKARKINKRGESGDFDFTHMAKPKTDTKKTTKTSTLFDLVKTPRLRARLLNCIYLWIVNAFVYYGLSYNTNDLAGDPYLNFFIAGVLEFPSYIIAYFMISRFGRRKILMSIMLIGGIACAAIIAVPESMPGVSTAFAMFGKFCITASFGILYLYSSELFPTVVRNVAIGSCSTFARIGSIVAPFVRELGKATHPAVPNALYALLVISSGLLALLLPETNNKKIADTLEEGERFGREENPEKETNSTSEDGRTGSFYNGDTVCLTEYKSNLK